MDIALRLALLAAFALTLPAAEFRTPAGTAPARRTESGAGTVLPGGRLLSPLGRQFATGPGPFGLAISPSGRRVVTADAGPGYVSLTVLENQGGEWKTRQLTPPRKREKEEEDADEWAGAFMGLAFAGEDTLYASEGDSGRVAALDLNTGRRLFRLNLNSGGFSDSYSGDLAVDHERNILYVLDQANFRVAVFSLKTRRLLASQRVGRLPFAMALSPDARRVYVTNIGMFQYQAIPGADRDKPRETGLPFPAFGFPSREAEQGARRETARGVVEVPGLGTPNAPEANSLAVIEVDDPTAPRLAGFVRTGQPFGPGSLGGSSPSGVLAAGGRVFVSNGVNDTISVIDPKSLAVEREIALRIAGLERLRGVLPMGMAWHGGRLLVAEAGINAIGVVDPEAGRLLGHLPAGWFPTRVALDGDTGYATNAKGHGIGPNATAEAPLPDSFQADRRKGSISRFSLAEAADLAGLTRKVLENNGFEAAPEGAAPPREITHVVLIIKENRTFDEVFGDIAGVPRLARYGRRVTPNHHAIAERWAMSDNFYADSEVSVDGHHWLVGSYPNAWTESALRSSYAGNREFRLPTTAPGRLSFAESNSSVHPEDLLEAGTLWHHLERHGISFRNFGEGIELAGINEGEGMKPTGLRMFTNVPAPDPLYRNTSREFPVFNTNIPDQFRATQFIREIETLYGKPGKPLPRLMFVHLSNDHTAQNRPKDGYPTDAAFVADNDLALGRILEYLSHTPWWRNMAVFVTEDDAQSGVDHVDAHRTVLLAAGPYIKKGYVAHGNSSFGGLLKTTFRILGLPPLNLFDATAQELDECFTAQPDFTPYQALPSDKAVFDPAKAREPLDPVPGPKMDDPAEIRRQHKARRTPVAAQ